MRRLPNKNFALSPFFLTKKMRNQEEDSLHKPYDFFLRLNSFIFILKL